MLQKTTLLLTLGALLAAGGLTAVRGTDSATPELRPDDSAMVRMERHMARRLVQEPADRARQVAPQLADERPDALATPPAAPGGAASADGPRDPDRQLTLWLDGDAFAALPTDLGQRLGSGQLGVEVTLALTSGRSAGEHVAADGGTLGIVSRGKPGASRRLRNGERHLGTWVPAFVAHRDNPLRNIPSRKLRGILTGTIRNWQELRGPDAEIRLVLPTDDDARAMLARTLIPGDRLAAGQPVADTEERCVAVAQSDLHALTVVSLAAAEQAGATPLTVDGVPPSVAGRRRGSYPYGIDLALIEGRSPSTAALRTVELLVGREAEFLLGSRISLPGGNR